MSQSISTLTIIVLITSACSMHIKHSIAWNSPELQQLSLDAEAQSDFKQFVEFMKKYNRSYSDITETHRVVGIFRRNLADAMKLQKQELGTALYGVTKFSDMEKEEVLQKYTGLKISETMFKNVSNTSSQINFKFKPLKFNSTLTNKEVDGNWRSSYCDVGKCCPIKDQKQCGSCYAFATVAVIESSHVQYSNEHVCLSEQEIVDCDNGCNGGNFPNATHSIRRMGGLAYEDDYPYHASQGVCQKPSGRKATIGPDIVVHGDEQSYYDALNFSPIYVIIDGTPLLNYQGGILRTGQSNWKLNHAVALVGVGVENGQKYWIGRNSWGYWGEEGYFRMVYGENELGLTDAGRAYRI